MGKKIAIILSVVFVTLGVFLRIYQIEKVPGGFFADESALAINAKTIAQSGTDEFGNKYPFGFESFSDYKMPGYIYSSAFVFKILGPRILTIRFTALVSGILSIFLFGYLLSLLFPNKKLLPFFGTAIFALSPYEIQFSRVAYETMFATTLMLLYFVAFIKITQSKNRMSWGIVGALALLWSCWTYPAPRFIIPVTTAVIFIWSLLVKKSANRKASITASISFLIVCALSFLPTILFPGMDKRPIGYLFGRPIWQTITETLSSYLRSFNLEYLFDKGDIFAFRHGTKVYGVFLAVFLIPFLVGMINYLKSFNLKSFAFVFVSMLLITCGLPSALTWYVPYGPRFLPMLIPLSILLALGTDSLFDYFKTKRRPIFALVGIFFVAILTYQIIDFSRYYFSYYPISAYPEFPLAPTQLASYLKQRLSTNSSSNLYFLEGKSCYPWSHDDLQLWYFLNLPNKQMIEFNNLYRNARYKTGDPFGAYDTIVIPSFHFGRYFLYPTYPEQDNAKAGDILIHCGVHLPNINTKKESIEKVFYLYPQDQRDPLYVVTKKI